jgi:hypothetical protein
MQRERATRTEYNILQKNFLEDGRLEESEGYRQITLRWILGRCVVESGSAWKLCQNAFCYWCRR